MKHTPLRSCIVCRAQRAKPELVRIVRKSDGEIVVDETGKLDGRGAYVCRSEKCAADLVKKCALNRVYKTKVKPEIYDKVSEELKRLCDECK